MAIDHVLKLYSQTIRSPYLHYGFWDKPSELILSELTLNDINNAQYRYIEHLSGFIPGSVKTILDVGCGIGGNTAYLRERGYEMEALSPDPYQEKIIKEKFREAVPFHKATFENYETSQKYDLILESESVCYIKMRQGFQKAKEILNPNGYILASDYFVYNENGESPHLKASHSLDKYLQIAREEGFEVIREYDQTLNTVPTLDAALYFVQRFVEPTVDYAITAMNRKKPLLLKVLKMAFNKYGRDKLSQMDLIRSDEFKKYRKYMIYLFQKQP